MNVALVQNAENDVDGHESRKNQQRLIGQGPEEGSRGALKRGLDARRHVQILLHAIDGVDRIAQSGAGRQVKRNSDHGKLALVVQRERSGARIEVRDLT